MQCRLCVGCDIEDLMCTNISCDNAYKRVALIREYKYYVYIQDMVYSIVK